MSAMMAGCEEELVAVPPLRPDVALLHAPIGDARGNLALDHPYVLDERFAAASAMVVATVDRLVSTEEVAAAGVVIPAPAPRGDREKVVTVARRPGSGTTSA